MKIDNAEIELEKIFHERGMNNNYYVYKIRWISSNNNKILVQIADTRISPQANNYLTDELITTSIFNNGTISCYEKKILHEIINSFPIDKYK